MDNPCQIKDDGRGGGRVRKNSHSRPELDSAGRGGRKDLTSRQNPCSCQPRLILDLSRSAPNKIDAPSVEASLAESKPFADDPADPADQGPCPPHPTSPPHNSHKPPQPPIHARQGQAEPEGVLAKPIPRVDLASEPNPVPRPDSRPAPRPVYRSIQGRDWPH